MNAFSPPMGKKSPMAGMRARRKKTPPLLAMMSENHAPVIQPPPIPTGGRLVFQGFFGQPLPQAIMRNRWARGDNGGKMFDLYFFVGVSVGVVLFVLYALARS